MLAMFGECVRCVLSYGRRNESRSHSCVALGMAPDADSLLTGWGSRRSLYRDRGRLAVASLARSDVAGRMVHRESRGGVAWGRLLVRAVNHHTTLRLTCARPTCTGSFVCRDDSNRKYCSVPCAQWGRRQKRAKHAPRKKPFTEETGPPITRGLDTLPRCGCGRTMYPTTDTLGRTILQCGCGKSAPVRIIGRHRYDQAQRHRQELVQLVGAGMRRVAPREWPGGHGDAFRQETHKRGAA